MTISTQRSAMRAARSWCLAAITTAMLAACGGNDGASRNDASAAADGTAQALAVGSTARVSDRALAASVRPTTRYEAGRFLTQASFGPNDFDVELAMKLGYGPWIDRQFALPATSHRAYWEAADAAIRLTNPTGGAGQDQVWESFWRQAVGGPEQLRLRVAYALSQIFVISAVDGNVGDQPRALAAWMDMLETKGLTTYRELIEDVALHPLMGYYLSHLRNQKADTVTGRQPDQNFAREIMQLFSIGLVRLNPDGTPFLLNGNPVETYGPEDVAGLAKVFTGWSFACPAAPNNNCFFNGSSGGVSDPDRFFKPMVGYPQFHSTEAKTFLGLTIPAQATANPTASLKAALDHIAAHPNVAPFISRQLIQRLVTSNPTPAYVQSVAAVFNNNGAGVRGDMKAVVKAILTHAEAQTLNNTQGKVREPVLRLAAYLRAFPHASDTGSFRVGNTDSPATSLGQTPLRSPSVFNFYRPGYVAPGTQAAAAGLVAPEMQLLNETSASGWVNFMRDNLNAGVGQFNGTVGTVVFNRRDLQRNWVYEMALATRPAELVTVVTDRLLYGQSNPTLNNEILTAITRINIPAPTGSNQTQIDNAKRNRVFSAILLTMASPEFLVQK